MVKACGTFLAATGIRTCGYVAHSIAFSVRGETMTLRVGEPGALTPANGGSDAATQARAKEQPSRLTTALNAVRALASIKLLDGVGFGLGAASAITRRAAGMPDDPPGAGAALQQPHHQGPGFKTPHFVPPMPPTGGVAVVSASGNVARAAMRFSPAGVALGVAVQAQQDKALIAYGLTRGVQVLQNAAHTTLGDFNGSVRAGQDAARKSSGTTKEDPHLGPVDISRAERAFNAELSNGSPESLRMQRGEYSAASLEGHFTKMSTQMRQTLSETTDPARLERYVGRLRQMDNYVTSDTQLRFFRTGDGVLQVALH